MAREFGSGKFLQTSATPIIGVPLSIAAWVYNTGTAYSGLVTIYKAGGNIRFSLNAGYSGAPGAINASASDGVVAYGASTAANWTASQWCHACAVFASDSSRMAYLNGANKGTNSSSVTVSGVDTTQVAKDRTTNYLTGLVAEVGIWNVALTDGEAQALGKDKLCPLLVRSEALVAYWPLYGVFSQEPDMRGRYPLTVTGATWAQHPPIVYPLRKRPVYYSVPAPAGTTVPRMDQYYRRLRGAA